MLKCGSLISFVVAMLACFQLMADDSPRALLEQSETVAYSIRGADDELLVRVSPVQETLVIGGTFGNVIGKTVEAAQNDRVSKRIEEVFGNDVGHLFARRLREALEAHAPSPVEAVRPFGSHAGFSSRREYQRARGVALQDRGYDSYLETKIMTGLFTSSVNMVTSIDADLYNLPSTKKVWAESIVVSPVPILGTDKLTKPTGTVVPEFWKAEFSADDEAIEDWVSDNGERLKEAFDQATGAAIEALMTALELEETARGHYTLGKMALYNKKFGSAEQHFVRALEMEPTLADARNGLVVAYGRDKRPEEALELALALVRAEPAYGPGWYNLAWLQALELGNAKAAAEPYQQALDLGMPRHKKIEKRIERAMR